MKDFGVWLMIVGVSAWLFGVGYVVTHFIIKFW